MVVCYFSDNSSSFYSFDYSSSFCLFLNSFPILGHFLRRDYFPKEILLVSLVSSPVLVHFVKEELFAVVSLTSCAFFKEG